MDHMAHEHDPARSYEPIDKADLERLGRVADAELDSFFDRNRHLADWRDRARIVALAQGGAEHYLRGQRGIWDLDVVVCFTAQRPTLLRRQVTSWDWGPSKFGRCPYDPPEYTGRAVDVKLWVIPERRDPIEAVREWLAATLAKSPDPLRKRDLAQEPVILIRPTLGAIAWDPGAPPLPGLKSSAYRPPVRLAPP
jgi:hypothetical protein